MTVRIVVAEDDFLVREGIIGLLTREEDLDVVAACADLPELFDAVNRHAPDVVLTDIRMPPTGTDEGIRAAATLRAQAPRIGVVVLSHYADPAYAVALLDDGAEGRAYLLKERVSEPEHIVSAVREVVRGGSVIDPKVVAVLVSGSASRGASAVARLTPRERELLSEMAQGKNNAAIAAELVISERAVEKHINSIFSKLDLTAEASVNKRVKAVLLYLGESAG